MVIGPGCASFATPEMQCQALAAKHGETLGEPDPAHTELVLHAELFTYVWPATAARPAARCSYQNNRVVNLTVGEETLFRRRIR